MKSQNQNSFSSIGLSDATNSLANGATTAHRPIGFIQYGNYPVVSHAQTIDQPVDDYSYLSSNPYFTAMMSAVQEFINGELSGHLFTVERLKDKMKAADSLFRAEHRDMERVYKAIQG